MNKQAIFLLKHRIIVILLKGGIKECPGKMIAGVLRKSIVVMTGGNLKNSTIVMMIGGNLKKNTIVMMIGGNLKNSIAMMIGVLNEISVAVNVSLFVVIVKENIGNILNVNLKERIYLLGPVNTRIYKKLTKYSQLFIY
ncbi:MULTISPECIES: hypothetical protein [Bacillus]|uniref:hypothetical protein n=1 Tax=Bacillus TaxID=1386 RepID=UPI000278C731|nr:MULTISPECIES: hypothetical protein [Bacillus]EJQ52018.1 hypothetical protein IEI_02550 [Bacillus wiedmannii]